jgi:dethiobiotin synthetase
MSDDARTTAVTRPNRLVVVVGTGTEVGKTWVSVRVCRELRAAGLVVAARKPAKSFDPGDHTTDAHLLAKATGEDRHDVCPTHRWYEIAMAPPMAAQALGRPHFTIDDLAGEISWGHTPPDLGLIETAGGVRSPIADDGDSIALVEALQPDIVVLVADAGLGTINGVRLSMEALDHASHVSQEVVVLNRFDGSDDLHRRNLAWLSERDGYRVVTSTASLTALLRPMGDDRPPARPR